MIKATPAKFTGRVWNAKNARMRDMPPITPGKIAPGEESSKYMPASPMSIRI